jgi:L-ascorbate metabolism protein UlaG (beta-lactamase superfamily)
MGIEGAVHAAEMVEPTSVIPLHYDTFPFIEVDLDDVRAAIEDAGFNAEVIDFGATVEL